MEFVKYNNLKKVKTSWKIVIFLFVNDTVHSHKVLKVFDLISVKRHLYQAENDQIDELHYAAERPFQDAMTTAII